MRRLPRSPFRNVLAGLAAGLVLTVGGWLQAQDAASLDLVVRSPFMPPEGPPVSNRPAPPPPNNAEQQLEFRGFFALDGDLRVFLKNRREQDGFWLRRNEEKNGLRIVEFDAKNRSVLLDSDGDEFELDLVTLTGSSEPLAVAGLGSAANPQPTTRPVGSVADGSGNPRVVVGATGDGTAPGRRRVLPRQPQWIRDRMVAQGLDPDRGMAQVPTAPPDFVPPPPPAMVAPPTLPPSTIPGPDPTGDSNTFVDQGDPTGRPVGLPDGIPPPPTGPPPPPPSFIPGG